MMKQRWGLYRNVLRPTGYRSQSHLLKSCMSQTPGYRSQSLAQIMHEARLQATDRSHWLKSCMRPDSRLQITVIGSNPAWGKTLGYRSQSHYLKSCMRPNCRLQIAESLAQILHEARLQATDHRVICSNPARVQTPCYRSQSHLLKSCLKSDSWLQIAESLAEILHEARLQATDRSHWLKSCMRSDSRLQIVKLLAKILYEVRLQATNRRVIDSNPAWGQIQATDRRVIGSNPVWGQTLSTSERHFTSELFIPSCRCLECLKSVLKEQKPRIHPFLSEL